MARFATEFTINQPKEFVDFIVRDFCAKEGFEYTQFKGENVWKKGIGMMTAPQFIKVEYQNGKVHLEAWMKYAILPGVYCGEMGVTGFWGFAVKQMLKSRVDALIALLRQPVDGAGAIVSEATDSGEAEQKTAAPIPVVVHDSPGKAIAAMITGILSIVLCFWPLGGFALGIIGIILGMQGRKSTKKGMGTAGLVCGIIGVILTALVFILAMVGAVLSEL